MNMKLMTMQRKYYSAAGEHGGDGGGSAGGNTGANNDGNAGAGDKSYTQAEVDALVQKAVAEQVQGLKAKNGEVIGDNKKLKEQLAKFDGVDPDAVKAILQRFSDDEEAKLIAEGKIDEVLNKRTERMKQAHEKEAQKWQSELEKAQSRADKFTAKVLADGIRAAGTEAGIHKTAFDDAIARGAGVFEVGDDGELTAKEGVLDAKGNPLTVKAWFDAMKETAPHWFPAPQGGGSGAVGSGRVKGSAAGTDKDRAAYFASRFNLPMN